MEYNKKLLTKIGYPINLKTILLTNNAWYRFYKLHNDRIRQPIVIAVLKVLSCKNKIRGYKKYKCSNQNCNAIKIVPHTCKSKLCSSCGKKATAIWIAKQNNILPNTQWQHITFTMPSELWDLFWLNRELQNKIAKLAADCILTIAAKFDVVPAIFTAIHTFGRDLKRNIHIHLSTTRIGLHKNLKKIKKLFFKQHSLMKMWKHRVIKLFKTHNIKLQSSLTNTFNNAYNFNDFLNSLYNKNWIVFCQKASSNHYFNVNYLGRYIKRPPIADSKLKHYDGKNVIFKYLDHKTNKYLESSFSVFDFIARLIQHIPDTNFRVIRYYGILANRVRGKLLPILYRMLGQSEKGQIIFPSYASLLISNFRHDPLKCGNCKSDMVLSCISYKNLSVFDLLKNHYFFAVKSFG